MVLSPKTVTVPTSGQNMVVFIISLEYRGPESELAEVGYEMARRRVEHRVRMETVEELAQKQLVAPHQEPPLEQAETAQEFFPEGVVVVNSGANGAGGTVDIKVQESDTTTDGDFADVAGAAFTQITEANDNNVYVGRLNLVGRKRYLRVVAVVGTAACDFGVEVILGAAKEAPVAQVNPAAFSL
jgi:hypothetical protein